MQIRKPTNRGKKIRCGSSLPSAIMFLFIAIWGFGVLYIRSYLEGNSVHPAQEEEEDQQQQQQIQRRRQQTAANPFYGWQPKFHSEVSDDNKPCKIPDCLTGKGTHKDHPTCNICNDNPADLGVVPQPLDSKEWVPDAKMLHSMLLDGQDKDGNPWPPKLSKDYCGPLGVFGGPHDDNKQLFDQVPIRGMPPATTTDNSDTPTIFCGVYTMEQNHAGNIRAMRETWAPHCDGFVAFSTASDPRIPALGIEHEGPEEYNNMWQKSRSIWKYIGDHYGQDFDYFILGGEDLLVIPPNLKAYLKSLKATPEDDLFAGRRFKGGGNSNYFNSGGAGYVLSRRTLRKFVSAFDNPACKPHAHTAMEDVMIAECLRKVFDIGLTDTRDDQLRERFHPFAPGNHLSWRFPAPGAHDWYDDYNKEWGLKLGVECCAPDSVSFHYIKKPATVRHLWSLLYDCQASS